MSCLGQTLNASVIITFNSLLHFAHSSTLITDEGNIKGNISAEYLEVEREARHEAKAFVCQQEKNVFQHKSKTSLIGHHTLESLVVFSARAQHWQA